MGSRHDAGFQRRSVAAVAAMPHDTSPCLMSGLSGTIGRTIVDHDHLTGDAVCLQSLEHFFYDAAHREMFVKCRNDDAYRFVHESPTTSAETENRNIARKQIAFRGPL